MHRGDGVGCRVLYAQPDDAGSCDGEPKNNLTISLLAGNDWDALRCCGP